MENPRPSVVHVVDDDAAVRDSMCALLESYGIVVLAYSSANEFLLAVPAPAQGCLLIDLHMPGISGLELLEILQAQGSMVPVIAMTGRSDAVLRERAVRAGAVTLLDKPVTEDVLLSSLARAFARAEVHAI